MHSGGCWEKRSKEYLTMVRQTKQSPGELPLTYIVIVQMSVNAQMSVSVQANVSIQISVNVHVSITVTRKDE